MNREIKFKIFLQHEETGYIIHKVFNYAEIFSGEALKKLKEIPRYFVIGKRQYTGLLDRNGKEIYFGYICRVDWNDKRYPAHNVEISWNEEECSIDIEGGSPKRDCENHYEVIGNVYENPDLIK